MYYFGTRTKGRTWHCCDVSHFHDSIARCIATSIVFGSDGSEGCAVLGVDGVKGLKWFWRPLNLLATAPTQKL